MLNVSYTRKVNLKYGQYPTIVLSGYFLNYSFEESVKLSERLLS